MNARPFGVTVLRGTEHGRDAGHLAKFVQTAGVLVPADLTNSRISVTVTDGAEPGDAILDTGELAAHVIGHLHGDGGRDALLGHEVVPLELGVLGVTRRVVPLAVLELVDEVQPVAGVGLVDVATYEHGFDDHGLRQVIE